MRTFQVLAAIEVDIYGQARKRWFNLGNATEQESGNIIMNLFTLPLGHTGWDGNVVLKPEDEEEKKERKRARR